MKTLDQMEPRIPISQPNYTCAVAGASYYLTTNLVAVGSSPVIRIVTNSVSLDLNGFSILGLAGTGNGMSIYDGCDNVRVFNGTIRDCFNHGIYAHLARQCNFEDLRIINNGRSSVSFNGLNAGILARVIDCRLEDNGGIGLVLNTNSLARNCTIASNTDGLKAADDGQIEHNTILMNSGNGLLITGAGNQVADNTVRGNGDNYNISGGNQLNLLLCEIPEVLSWPCSVKLAGTLACTVALSNGITVSSDNVTIDLGGHALIGPGASSGNGIYGGGALNLRIYNGKLVNWQGPTARGLYTLRTAALSDVQAISNNAGFYVGKASVLVRCSAQNNQGIGFDTDRGCSLSSCTAYNNSDIGMRAGHNSTLSDCASDYNGGTGIEASGGNTLNNCTANYNSWYGFLSMYSTLSGCAAINNTNDGVWATGGEITHFYASNNRGNGIWSQSGCVISECVAEGNGEDGISIASETRLVGCASFDNGWNGASAGAGIHATGSGNRIENNQANRNDIGITVDAARNFISRNTAYRNDTNWVVAAGNVCLVINASTNGAAINGNSGGTAPGSTDPNANFTF